MKPICEVKVEVEIKVEIEFVKSISMWCTERDAPANIIKIRMWCSNWFFQPQYFRVLIKL